MDPIALARLLLADRDPLNYIFTDEELQYLIDKNTVHTIVEAQVKDSEYRIFEYNDYEFVGDEIKVINPRSNRVITDFQFFPTKRRVVLAQPIDTEVLLIEGDVLDVDNLRADGCEMIAVDFRKLQNYSIQNATGNLDSAKEHLFRLARYFRKPRVKVEW